MTNKNISATRSPQLMMFKNPKKNKLESSPSKNLYVYIWDREEAGTGKTDDVQEWDRHLTW